jgi:hypothetical protein
MISFAPPRRRRFSGLAALMAQSLVVMLSEHCMPYDCTRKRVCADIMCEDTFAGAAAAAIVSAGIANM